MPAVPAAPTAAVLRGSSLQAFEAATLELAGVKFHGPLVSSPPAREGAAAASWSLGPLAAAEGAIGAEIVDAHLGFDADVTVPIRQGWIHFNDATVEHVGPDSRMGVSRLGIYVDAPNGRSYLYQFAAAPTAGVEYEQRGALLGAMVSDRGSLQLQPFVQALLAQLADGHALGVTEQARMLFDRTAIQGEVRLGDGKFTAPGVQVNLAGRAAGHNTLRLHSEAVGRGLTVEIDSLLVRNAVLDAGGTQLRCDEIAGTITLRLFVEGSQLSFAFEVATMKLSGLRTGVPGNSAAPLPS